MALTKPSPEMVVRILRDMADRLESGRHEMLSGEITVAPMYECLSMPYLPLGADRKDHYVYDYSQRVSIDLTYRRVRPEKAAP